jgi:Putative sensor
MSAWNNGGQADAGNDPLAASLRLYRNPLRQAVSASTWRGTWYLLAYLGVGWVLFSVVLTAGITAITLAITLAGLPLLIATAAVIRGCAATERWRLRSLLPGRVRVGYRDLNGLRLVARVRATWTDPAIWRDLAYLGGLFPALWTLDVAVITVWLTFVACVALPAWYWAIPAQTYPGGTFRGVQFGYSPHGPHGPGSVGIFVDTPGKAVMVAAVFLVLSLLFQYVVVLTARLHARVACSLLRAPVDPLAEAKEVLGRPGPLGPLRNKRRNGNSGRSAPVT